MGTQKKDDDFEERAAIREFDASYLRAKAEQLAAADLIERKEQQEIYERQRAKQTIESLQERWYSVGTRMRAETDPARKDELFREWMDLAAQINELRRDSKNVNDKGLSS